MSRTRKWIMVAVCVFIVLALALSGFLAVILISGQNPFGNFVYSTAELANRQVFSAAVEVMEIEYSSDSVYIERSNTDEIILEEYMTSWSDDMLANVQDSGSTLRISSGKRPIQVMSVWISKIVIYIPESWNGTLDMQTSSGAIRTERELMLTAGSFSATSGSIRLENLEVAEGLRVTTSSGAIHIGDVTAGAGVELAATSGSVRAGRVQAAAISATATSGSVKLDGADAATINVKTSSGSQRVGELTGAFAMEMTSGSIHVDRIYGHGSAQGSSGSIRLGFSEVTGDVRVSATSGNITMEVTGGNAFHFIGSCSSGSIRTGFDEISLNDKRNSASGTVGEDAQYTIECKTSSGSIRLNG